MIWSSPTHGILECGCEVDPELKVTTHCPAHLIGTPVKLQPFSLDQSARIRRLEQELASSRAAKKKAQLYRHRLNLDARKSSPFITDETPTPPPLPHDPP